MEYHPTRVSSPAELARFLNESDQTIHNWSKRGLPKTKVFDLAMKVGCNGVWLRDGKGPKSAASLKTVRYAIDEFVEDEGTNKKTTYLRNCRLMISASLPARWLMSCNPETSRHI